MIDVVTGRQINEHAYRALKDADDHIRYGFIVASTASAFIVFTVSVGLLPPIVLITNVFSIFFMFFILINGLGHWRLLWRVWRPFYVVANFDHDSDEVREWAKEVVDPHDYHQHNRSHVYAFRRAQDAVAFKLVWG